VRVSHLHRIYECMVSLIYQQTEIMTLSVVSRDCCVDILSVIFVNRHQLGFFDINCTANTDSNSK